jgi:hypothetical protein
MSGLKFNITGKFTNDIGQILFNKKETLQTLGICSVGGLGGL